MTVKRIPLLLLLAGLGLGLSGQDNKNPPSQSGIQPPEQANVVASPRTLNMPSKAVKPDKDAQLAILSAKTVALLVVGDPAVTFVSKDKRTIVVTEHGGIRRSVDPQKARREMENVLKEWGRFAFETDVAKADLVLALAETSVPPSTFTQLVVKDNQYRLRSILVVFRGGPNLGTQDDKPLWASAASENAFSALATTPTTSLTKKFRSDVESLEKKKQ